MAVIDLLGASITSLDQIRGLCDKARDGDPGERARRLNLHMNQIKDLAGLSRFALLEELILSGNCICHLRPPDFARLSSLRLLDLSCNALTTITGLRNLNALEELRLAYNQIQTLEGLQQFWGQRFRLRLLDLRCNKIGALPQLLFLGGCTKLETLAFQEEVGGDSNPICAEPNYRMRVVQVVPWLRVLDGSAVQEAQRVVQESQQVDICSRADSDRLRHPSSQLLDESRHLEAQYEAAEHQAAEAQAEALTAQKAARQAQDQRTQAMKKAESEREAKIHSDLEEIVMAVQKQEDSFAEQLARLSRAEEEEAAVQATQREESEVLAHEQQQLQALSLSETHETAMADRFKSEKADAEQRLFQWQKQVRGFLASCADAGLKSELLQTSQRLKESRLRLSKIDLEDPGAHKLQAATSEKRCDSDDGTRALGILKEKLASVLDQAVSEMEQSRTRLSAAEAALAQKSKVLQMAQEQEDLDASLLREMGDQLKALKEEVATAGLKASEVSGFTEVEENIALEGLEAASQAEKSIEELARKTEASVPRAAYEECCQAVEDTEHELQQLRSTDSLLRRGLHDLQVALEKRREDLCALLEELQQQQHAGEDTSQKLKIKLQMIVDARRRMSAMSGSMQQADALQQEQDVIWRDQLAKDAAAAETRLKEVDVLHAADREREEESVKLSSLVRAKGERNSFAEVQLEGVRKMAEDKARMFEAKVGELESQGARVLQQARLAQSEMEERFRSERAEQQSQEQSHRSQAALLGEQLKAAPLALAAQCQRIAQERHSSQMRVRTLLDPSKGSKIAGLSAAGAVLLVKQWRKSGASRARASASEIKQAVSEGRMITLEEEAVRKTLAAFFLVLYLWQAFLVVNTGEATLSIAGSSCAAALRWNMNGPFTFADAPEEYLDFLQEKRRQIFGLILGSVASGVMGAAVVATLRGDPLDVALPAVLTMGALLVFSAVGLGAYGFTQGGSRREL
ncbi:LRRCC1 [Symbiodinium sp. KB8]|nr:LRRCC1 [Symbiodinium sp. KB8]